MQDRAHERIDHARRGEGHHQNREAHPQHGVEDHDRTGERREAQHQRNATEIWPHERHIRPAQGNLADALTEGDADVRSGESERIVDAVTDHHDLAASLLLRSDDVEFLLGENLGDHIVEAQILRHAASDALAVAGDMTTRWIPGGARP